MATAGRKSKYTKATVDRVCEAISKGSTYALAQAYAGISHTTFDDWMNTQPAFFAAVKGAEAEAANRWLDMIERSAQEGNWQAAAWKLERRHPDDYGRRERQQVEHSGGMDVNISISRRQEKTEGEAGK